MGLFRGSLAKSQPRLTGFTRRPRTDLTGPSPPDRQKDGRMMNFEVSYMANGTRSIYACSSLR